nr:hypothetical protein [Tanacetum cinerariifolium]
ESNKERIESLSKQLETLKLEKDRVDGKLAGLLKASNNLDNLIESQSAVPPPAAYLYLSPKKDLSWTGLPEFADDTVTDYSRPSPSVESTSEEGQNKNSSTSEDVASPITHKYFVKFVRSKDFQSESKTNKKETPKKPQVKYAEQYRQSNKKPNVRGNQRNWNNLKSYQLGPEFVLKKKSCFKCGDFTHLANDCRKRVKRRTTRSQNNAYMRPPHRPAGHRPHVHPVRPSMNCTRPNISFFNIQAHSYETKPFHKTTAVKTQYRAPWVPTINRNNSPINRNFSIGRRNFPTANWKFPTGSRKFPTDSTKIHTADMGRKGKAVKSSACWIWKPSQNLSNKGSSQNNIDDKGYWDSGCSRYMTGNISYLYDFEPFDRGYVSFGQGGCKITGKGIIKTECIVFGRDFKLLDIANILLRTPRQHNMYSIDLNNIVPHRNLTFLVAKASANECTLWHRRLGHLNVKTMNKLVRHNLIRGLPTKSFNNDHTCIACLKGKQHKASCKSKLVNSVTKPIHTLHIDLFGPTSVSSISHKWYCLVVTDDFSRFTWTFFLRTKDETSGILKKFINEIENLKDLKVKIIRVLVIKSQNKTPYELFNGITPAIGFLKPFGCHVMNLNTLDHLGKFEAKEDEAHLESSTSNAQDACNADAPESSGNFNSTTTSTNPPADHMETLAVETLIPTVSFLVPTACLNDSPEPSSDTRLISKSVTSQDDTPSLDNILTLTNRPIGTKWVLKNKKDERGIVIRNKARLVAQGHTQEERIDYDEVFAPVARIKAIRLFLAYASFMGFTDPESLARVYKVEKAMYGLHQAPRAWYVYVDDIISGSSNPQLCREFEALMHEKFQMSAMGELNLFLGLQVLQKKDDISLSQDKYVEHAMRGSVSGNHIIYTAIKYEHNTDFHQIVDFVEASHLRRNLKLREEAGISSLPNAELFENLTLMGYNILPNQKFSFQKGQFSHQWKYLIHIIMQCLSLKSTGFNEFNNNITTALVYLATNRVYNFSKMIFDGMVRNVNNKVSKFSMYPRQYTRRARIAQSSALPTAADEPASPIRDDSQGEACPTISGLKAEQDRVNITKTSTLPSDSTPRVTTFAADESRTPTEPHHTPSPEAQQTSHTATSSPSLPPSSALPPVADESASPIGDDSQGKAYPTNSGLEAEHDMANITKTSTLPSDSTPRHLEDRDGGGHDSSREDATIKWRRLEAWEEAGIERSMENRSDGTEEMVNVLTSLDAASVLSSGVQVSVPPTAKVATVSIPPAGEIHPISVPTGSGVVPTASPIFTTATVATPYTRRKEEELQMMIDGLDMSNEMIAKHLHEYDQAAAELTIEEKIELINKLVKHSIINWEIQTEGKRSYWKIIRLGGSTTSYQFFVDMLKYFDREDLNQLWALVKETLNIRQATRNKEKELWVELKRLYEPDVEDQLDQEIFMLAEREYPLRKGLAIVMISNKLQVENYSQMASDLIQKIHKIANSPRQRKEDLKEMMQLVSVEEVYVEALQVKHPIIDWETHTEGQRNYWKIIRLGGSTVVYQFFVDMLKHFNREDLNQLWTLVKETLSIRQATSDKEKEL